ncbi:MAG: pyridoxine 5'-phosphate synthase [Burkholderiaceae bacterium]|jgi:pyridoxine 5-phosphate synthase|nr:pyridoxine 5'-phosphate synthase [Burkholderiaceae bacterium]
MNTTAPPATTRLSVNVNKVAHLRNTRHLGIPDVVRAATLCLQAGAQGITVHPRPDERHIRAADVHAIAQLLQAWPGREYNIEGNPGHNLMGFMETARPDQCTFVPDSIDQFTSDHGWALGDAAVRAQLAPLIARARALGARVSLFVDPDPALMAHAKALGADRVELYTEPYAAAWASGDAAQRQAALDRYAQAARAAQTCGLQVNAGHDLNQDNLTAFLRHVPQVAEVSIGHALIADALEAGYAATVRAYLACIAAAVAGQRR